MRKEIAQAEAQLAEVAGGQYGVVSVAQLHRLGFGDEAIHRRVAGGRLHRVHRGVYAVGHSALSIEGRSMAAVLAVSGGPNHSAHTVLAHWRAAVSHRSAALLWGLLPIKPGPCDVIVAGRGGRARRSGLRVHRSLSLSAAEVTLRRGIPTTTPMRTIADLRNATATGRPGRIPSWELRKAIRQAGVIGLPIESDDAADRTRSDLEADFLAICRRHRIPRPEINVPIGPYLVDFFWPEARLVVEADGYRYHRGEAAFQDDRARDLELRRLGFDLLRLSERQIEVDQARVAKVLSAALVSPAR